MITNFKIYEAIEGKPKVDDYVIVNIKNNEQGYYAETLAFIRSHIGQIVHISKKGYEIYYEQFPFSIENDYVIALRKDIDYFSKNKKELENIKKFNL